jgi:hypothetical protein
MTSGITQITAASDGEDTAQRPAVKREHGLAALRGREAKALISLASEALSETHSLAYEMHTIIYGQDAATPNAELQDQLAEALACMETAEHYLLMLGSVFDDHPNPDRPVTGP